MTRRLDLTGRQFGRLTVRHRVAGSGGKGGNVRWSCECICGGSTNSPTTSVLLAGKARSCGCVRRTRFLAGRSRIGSPP